MLSCEHSRVLETLVSSRVVKLFNGPFGALRECGQSIGKGTELKLFFLLTTLQFCGRNTNCKAMD